MAVFRLQSSIGDPSFAEVFIAQGGLAQLRNLALYSNGNTLAYALTSFSRLLELDKGWDYVTPELISRVRSCRQFPRLLLVLQYSPDGSSFSLEYLLIHFLSFR